MIDSTSSSLFGRDLITLPELTTGQLQELLETALRIKADPAAYCTTLANRTIVLLFEKPSLRTRMTFEIGMRKLGGAAIYFDHGSTRIGERETIHDYARNLERWTDAIVARTFSHATIEQLAEHASIPVINALSDFSHPCQALADFLTLREQFGELRGRTLVYIGDGNNVCHSLLFAAGMLGVHLRVVTPPGHAPLPEVVTAARTAAELSGATIHVTESLDAVEGADAVYTDTWVSMGQEAEGGLKKSAFEPYQVNAALMARAGADARFMHCLPAHRGEEVTDEVIDSPNSIVFDQAENRMHAQNALLHHLLHQPGSG